MDAEIHVNGIKVATLGKCDDKDCVASEGDVYEYNCYMFGTGCGTHWKGFTIGMSFGPFPPLGLEYPRDPREMKDEDVDEVMFKFASISIAEEGNEDDVLLGH